LNVEKPGFISTGILDFSGLSDNMPRKTRGSQLQPVLKESRGLSTFIVSSCSNYLLVTNGCMIYVYHLLGRISGPLSSNDMSDVNLVPVSRISCPFDVLSAVIDTSTPQFTVAALLNNRVGMICDLDMAFAEESSIKSSQFPQMPTADPTTRHFFYNICTTEAPPRTIAICPGRRLVGFGCAAGIEIHSANETRRNEQRKYFPMPQPSETLHFLPSSPGTPNELRLISSLAGPGFHECKCPPSPTPSLQSPTLSPTPQAKNQFHFLADVQSFSRRRIPHTPSRSFVRATHCHHYRAVPINDSFHIMFIEPRTSLLCIGSSTPIGGPASLTRAFICIPPFANSPLTEQPPIPTTFAAGSDLSWGLRVVAAYGNRIVLYSIPLDVYNVICKERERQGDGVMGDSDLPRDWYVDADRSPKRRESLTQNQNGDWEFLLSVSYRPTAMMWPFKIYGKEIGSVDGLVELSLQSSEGGVRVWAFGANGKATVFDVDTFTSVNSGPSSVPISALRVGAEGGVESLKTVKRGGPASSRKRKAEILTDGFAGRYGAGRHSADGLGLVKPCAAGVHGVQQDPSVRRSSFAACILDFKIPELGI
jgi:hypothetical protein